MKAKFVLFFFSFLVFTLLKVSFFGKKNSERERENHFKNSERERGWDRKTCSVFVF